MLKTWDLVGDAGWGKQLIHLISTSSFFNISLFCILQQRVVTPSTCSADLSQLVYCLSSTRTRLRRQPVPDSTPQAKMSKPTLNKRRPSFPSSAPKVVLSNVDTPATALKPPMALIKHGKYVLAGAGGMWYTGFMDAVGSVLENEKAWIRSVWLYVGGMGLTR